MTESNNHRGSANATIQCPSNIIYQQDGQVRTVTVHVRRVVYKITRPGANPWRIVEQIRTKLRIPAAAVQVPIGVEDELVGVVDLVRWKAIYNQGEKG